MRNKDFRKAQSLVSTLPSLCSTHYNHALLFIVGGLTFGSFSNKIIMLSVSIITESIVKGVNYETWRNCP